MTSIDMQELRGVPGKVRQMLLDYADARRAINESPRIRLNAGREEIDEATQSVAYDLSILSKRTQTAIEGLGVEADERAQRVSMLLRQSLRPSAGSGEADLARETAEDRAWRRLEKLLEREATKPPEGGMLASAAAMRNMGRVQEIVADAMRSALAEGDEHTVQALLSESAAFMRFHFDEERAADVKSALIGAVADARPSVAAMLQQQEELEEGTAAVRLALSTAARGVFEGRSLIVLPGWPGGDPVEDVLLAADGDEIAVSGWGGVSRTLRLEQSA